MADLEWLITDRFTLNSAGKSPQSRRMESAAKCFSSKILPTTLNFAATELANDVPNGNYTSKSPLRDIQNYLRGKQTSPKSAKKGHGTLQDKMFGQEGTFTFTTASESHWTHSNSGQFSFGNMDEKTVGDFSSESNWVGECSSAECFSDVDMLDDLVPECSGMKMARLDKMSHSNKENFISFLNSDRNTHVLCDNVVRSPTRLDLSCLQSPAKRKSALMDRRQENRPTPSKFTIVRNNLNKSPPFAIPTPKKYPLSTDKSKNTLGTSLDYTSRDSGFENSLSFEEKMAVSILDQLPPSLGEIKERNMTIAQSRIDSIKFHDELTQSACHFDGEMTQKHSDMEMYQSLNYNPSEVISSNTQPIDSDSVIGKQSNNRNSKGLFSMKSSPHAHCSKDFQPDVDVIDEFEYENETLHSLEEYENDQGGLPLIGSSMSKYEIISTDSPNDPTSNRVNSSTVAHIMATDLQFGSPIGDEETSENFGSNTETQTIQKTSHSTYSRIATMARTETTRILNFDTPSPTRSNGVRRQVAPLQDGGVFKLAIEKLSSKYIGSNKSREVTPYDSGLGVEEDVEDEDTLLVLDELEKGMEHNDLQSSTIHSLIHDTVIHNVHDDEDLFSANSSSPLSLPGRRPTFRRCFSLNQTTDKSNKQTIDLFNESPKSGNQGPFKHPHLSRGTFTSLLGRKRRKQSAGDLFAKDSLEMEKEFPQVKNSRPALQRAMSDNEATIKMALTRSLEDTDLIGDFTSAYSLPVVRSQHTDLKVISPDTLAGLFSGEYTSAINSFKIIDCRYPYEYEGGHILGALNLYTEQQIYQQLVTGHNTFCMADNTISTQRNILIFHCEFSLQRGPKLVRYLRCVDRALHCASYPSLLHPELYLLGGGYSLFSTKHPALTQPQGSYTTMLDPLHVEERKKYQFGKTIKGKNM